MEPDRVQMKRASRGGCSMLMSFGDLDGDESKSASVLVTIEPAAELSFVTTRRELSRATSMPSIATATVTFT